MIFLDNASTTKPKFFAKDYSEYWLNSNTPYAHIEKRRLNDARERIKKCLGVKSGYILFTRSATESIQWLCNHFAAGKTWCSPYEHDSVYDACEHRVLNSLTKDEYDLQEYSLYCHQLVNQITGVIFDIKAEHDRYITMHNQMFGVDVTAAIGHIDLPKNMDKYCDALWGSSHKFYGEKGIGFLWISRRMFGFLGGEIDPQNQFSLIHGTVSTPSVCAMVDAMEYATNNYHPYIYKNLVEIIMRNGNLNWVCLPESNMYPNYTAAINLLYLPNINADALQTFLASRGIYVGIAGSACSALHDYRVPMAFGLTEKQCEQSIRISFSEDTTEEEVVALTNTIKEFKEKFV